MRQSSRGPSCSSTTRTKRRSSTATRRGDRGRTLRGRSRLELHLPEATRSSRSGLVASHSARSRFCGVTEAIVPDNSRARRDPCATSRRAADVRHFATLRHRHPARAPGETRAKRKSKSRSSRGAVDPRSSPARDLLLARRPQRPLAELLAALNAARCALLRSRELSHAWTSRLRRSAEPRLQRLKIGARVKSTITSSSTAITIRPLRARARARRRLPDATTIEIFHRGTHRRASARTAAATTPPIRAHAEAISTPRMDASRLIDWRTPSARTPRRWSKRFSRIAHPSRLSSCSDLALAKRERARAARGRCAAPAQSTRVYRTRSSSSTPDARRRRGLSATTSLPSRTIACSDAGDPRNR